MRERSFGEMTRDGASALGRMLGRAGRGGRRKLEVFLGGPDRARVIFLLAAVLALASADAATVGASAIELRQALKINNFDIGLLIAVTSIVAAVASIPFGVLADRSPRTRVLGLTIFLWGAAMVWSSTVSSFGRLLVARLFLGVVTAAAGPIVASLVGDLFSADERGKIYGYILTGELLGAGIGFAVTGDIAALSWRAAFLILAIPAFFLAWFVFNLPEPVRSGRRLAGFPAARETDAQRLARSQGVVPHAHMVGGDPERMGLFEAARYVLGVRTNVILIVASAAGYYFLAGVQTFGVEFVRQHYRVDAVLANGLMLVIGGGAVVGILAGGAAGDALLHRGRLNGRILVSALAAGAATLLFVPALLTRSLVTAVPYVTLAALALSAQRAPMDAARLDIIPPPLWGRAEGIRTLLRTGAQALAPLLFGLMADYVGLQATFLVMLLPLAAGSVYLFKGLKTYPQDIATAAAAGGG
jgi:MFS family permease